MFEIFIAVVVTVLYLAAPVFWMWRISLGFSDEMLDRGRTSILDDDFLDGAMDRAYDKMAQEQASAQATPILVGGSGCLSFVWHWVAWPLYFHRIRDEYIEYLHYLADELTPW